MGGRGAASGMSDGGKSYGSQYNTLFKSGNIKFVKKNERTSENLLETVTPGRVYVTVGGNELQNITYFDRANKRNKVINLNHPHKREQPHVHHGYFHNENDGPKGATRLSDKEKRMVDRVKRLWDNYLGK